jgi:hypothetical protein
MHQDDCVLPLIDAFCDDGMAPGDSGGFHPRATASPRLGITVEAQEAAKPHARAATLKPHRQTVRLLSWDIPVVAATDATLRVKDDGKTAGWYETLRPH